jgi:hypothetical protein
MADSDRNNTFEAMLAHFRKLSHPNPEEREKYENEVLANFGVVKDETGDIAADVTEEVTTTQNIAAEVISSKEVEEPEEEVTEIVSSPNLFSDDDERGTPTPVLAQSVVATTSVDGDNIPKGDHASIASVQRATPRGDLVSNIYIYYPYHK